MGNGGADYGPEEGGAAVLVWRKYWGLLAILRIWGWVLWEAVWMTKVLAARWRGCVEFAVAIGDGW